MISVPNPGSLATRIRAVGQKFGDRPAIWDDGATATHGELHALARKLGDCINALVAPGLPVALLLPRSLESFIGIVAALLTDRAYVPLNSEFPPERLMSICRSAQPGAVLCCEETRAKGEALLGHLPEETCLFSMEGDLLKRGEVANAVPLRGPGEDTAYLIFTSGSTGEPKGVRITQANVCAYLDSIDPLVQVTQSDRLTQFPDHYFDLSVHDIFVGLTSGAELCILPKHRLMEVTEFVRERDITAWCSVPSVLAFCEKLGHLAPGSLPSIRVSVFCGEPLPTRLAAAFAKAAPNMRLINLYGPTEATVALTAYEIKDFDAIRSLPIVPLGWAMGEQICRIDAPEGELEGEIILGGSQVSKGYINAPELNVQKFFTGADGVAYYRTGDIGRRSEDFGAVFVSRIDDQVKVNGYRIELHEIDAAVARASGSAEVAAIAWPITADGHAEGIVAFVVAPKATATDIRKACRKLLPSYMVPRQIVEIDHMPLSVNGKIDRKVLKKTMDAARP